MVGVCMFIKAVNDGLSNTIWDDRGHWIAQIRGFSGPLSWSAVCSLLRPKIKEGQVGKLSLVGYQQQWKTKEQREKEWCVSGTGTGSGTINTVQSTCTGTGTPVEVKTGKTSLHFTVRVFH